MDQFVALISKPIADGFFPLVFKNLVKDKMYDPERNARIYDYLYNDVSAKVKEYFTTNPLNTKQEVESGIKNIIDELSVELTATPSSCPVNTEDCYLGSFECSMKSAWANPECGCCYKSKK